MFNRIRNNNVFHNQHGQVALILILVIALGLIFYAVTLNWGRIAQHKTITTVASNLGAAQMGAMIASYGQYQIQTVLGGQAERCEWASLLEILIAAVIVIILVVIIIVFPPAGGIAPLVYVALIAAVVMAVAAVVIEVAVLQPGLTSLWNKMQIDAPLEDRIIEDGIRVALQSSATDNKQVPDAYDYNFNGKFTGNAPLFQRGNDEEDTISRFAYYYTDRLRSVQRLKYPEIQNFVDGLNELVNDNPFDKERANFCIQQGNQNSLCCTAPPLLRAVSCPNQPRDFFGLTDNCANRSDPRCNPCCVPLDAPNPIFNPNFCVDNPEDICCTQVPRDGCPNDPRVRLRPASCGNAPVPEQCDRPYRDDPGTLPHISYPLVYDPFALNYSDNSFISFRERLGFDDENRHYFKDRDTPLGNQMGYTGGEGNAFFDTNFRPEDATGFFTTNSEDKPKGIFPFLWKMGEWGVDVYSNVFAPPPPATNRVDYLDVVSRKPNHCRWCSTQYTDCVGVTMATGETPLVLPSSLASPAGDPTAYTCSGPDECCVHSFDNNLTASGGVFGSPGIDPRKIDKVTPIPNIAAREEMCAHRQDPSQGIWWKKGGDMYCSTQWPYFADCIKHGSGTRCQTSGDCDLCNQSFVPNPGDPPNPEDPRIWPDDPIDNIVYGIPSFLRFAQVMMDMEPATLRASFTEWYENAKQWIARSCTTDCSICNREVPPPSCTPEVIEECRVCNAGTDGTIRLWQQTFQRWAEQIDAWLTTTTFVGANERDIWCVPPRANSDPVANNNGMYMTIKERDVIDAIGSVWGDLGDVINCHNYNLDNATKFSNCHNNCSHTYCKDLPRSLVDGFNPNKDFQDNPPPPDDATACFNADASSCLALCNRSPINRPEFSQWKDVHGLPEYDEDACAGWNAGGAEFTQFETTYLNGYFNSICYGGMAPPAHPLYSIFREKLIKSAQLAQLQRAKLDKRVKFLEELKTKAEGARQVFSDGAAAIGQFLDGPVEKLIQAREKFEENDKKLFSFVIYGWESPTRPRWKQPDGQIIPRPAGYWHVVRVETFIPKRCSASLSGCGADRFPWVKTDVEAIGLFRCYFLDETTGNVKIRVTRFDEDHDYAFAGGLPRFANGSPIWKFVYNKPGTPDYQSNFHASSLGEPVYGGGGCYGYGYSQAEAGSFNQPGTDPPPLGAFMINRAPRTNEELLCWDHVHALLARGVVTESCAQYYSDNNHMNVRFKKCPRNSFSETSTTYWDPSSLRPGIRRAVEPTP